MTRKQLKRYKELVTQSMLRKLSIEEEKECERLDAMIDEAPALPERNLGRAIQDAGKELREDIDHDTR